MGNKFVVKSWVPEPCFDDKDCIKHVWEEVYAGDNMEEALMAMCSEKMKDIGCVILEWR